MIVPLLLSTVATATVVELPIPSAQEISIQAIVKLPRTITPDEREMLGVLARTIPDGTREYPRRAMLTVTNGAPVTCEVMPDTFRISILTLPGGLTGGLGLIESLVFRAALRDEDLIAADADPKPVDYWWRALEINGPTGDKFEPAAAREVYARLFRPERITLAVGGSFVPGEAQAVWRQRMSRLDVAPAPRPSGHDYSVPKPYASVADGIATIDFSASAPADGILYRTILALFALGSGKGSSLFRVVREQMHLSYRQESVLWPAPEGFQARLLIATTNASANVEAIRKAMLADIDTWTESQRLRALGMADSCLNRGNVYGPLYLSPEGPVSVTLEAKTFEAGYWKLKTGSTWDARQMLQELRDVPLDELKSEAKRILAAPVRVVAGKGANSHLV